MGAEGKQIGKQHIGSEKAELLKCYHNSGLSQKEWCRAQGVAISTFGKWLKLEKELGKSEIKSSQAAQVWAPVAVLPPARTESVILKVGKFSITVGENTDKKLLLEVLSVLVTLC